MAVVEVIAPARCLNPARTARRDYEVTAGDTLRLRVAPPEGGAVPALRLCLWAERGEGCWDYGRKGLGDPALTVTSVAEAGAAVLTFGPGVSWMRPGRWRYAVSGPDGALFGGVIAVSMGCGAVA